MILDREAKSRLIRAVAERLIAHTEELTALDQAIGDGDHGINMKRGCEAVLVDLEAIVAKPLPEALKAAGTTLVMKVGGASGPLYGTLFLALGKALADEVTLATATAAFGQAKGALVLERQPGADPEGYAGLEDQVDYHWSGLFMAAALSTLLSVGSELGASNTDNDIVRALRRGSSDSLNQTGHSRASAVAQMQPSARASWRPSCSAWRYAGTF